MKVFVKQLSFIFFLFCFFLSFKAFANLSTYTFSQGTDTGAILNNATTLSTNNFDHTIYFGTATGLGVINNSSPFYTGIPIGFSFVFDGDTQNVFGATSRGYMVLGKNSLNMALNPSTNPISGGGYSNMIAALGGYLNPGSPSVLKYKTIGAAPNRTLIVQWLNMRRPNYQGLDSLYFQIRLHETTNAIDLVYTKMVVSTKIPDSFFEVGLRGKVNGNFFNRRLISGWNASAIGYTQWEACMLGKHIFPTNGTVYTFTPPTQNCGSITITPYISAKNYATCSNHPIALSLDTFSVGNGTLFKWQASTDSINWTTISGAVNASLSKLQSGTSFYRCILTCATDTLYSNTLKILQFITSQCYCDAVARYPDNINIGKVQLAGLTNGSATTSVSTSIFHSYTDFGNLGLTNLVQGANYSATVSEIFKTAYIKSSVVLYIDFNKDGIFNDTTEQFYLGRTKTYSDGYHAKGFVQIPPTALAGITKMRVMLYDPNSALPFTSCTPAFYGETEDYLVNIIASAPCVLVPDTIVASATVSKVCAGTQFKLFLASPLLENFSYQWFQSSDTLNWIAISGADKNYLFTTLNATSYYRCLVKCAGFDSVYTNVVKINLSEFYYCYCTSKANNPSDVQLSNVQLIQLNNSSAGSTKLYSNFTNLAPDTLVIGGTHLLSVKHKKAGGFKTKAYVDFDHDGIFGNNTNEVFAVDSTHGIATNLASVFSALLTVPANADTGITGMRIIIDETTINASCGINNHGETEDYLVWITPADSCKFPLNAGITVASDTSLCDGEIAHVFLSGISYSPLYTYQWQTSMDSTNWTDVANQNLFSLNRLQTNKTYYRCKVSCSGNFAFSEPVVIPRRYALFCYCASSALQNNYLDIGNIKIADYNFGADTLVLNPTANFNYSNFIDSLPPIVLELGGFYPLTVQLAQNSTSSFWVNVAAFIDFNRNGVFESNESYYAPQFYSGSSNKATVNITIPLNAALGISRMRIVLSDANSGTNPIACGTYAYYGETEDYAIEIITALPCQPLVHAAVSTSKNNLCPGELFTLKSTGISFQPHLSYNWQISSDTLNWNSVASGFNSEFTDSLDATAYFRCVSSCETESDTSAILKMIKNPLSLCYCASSPSYWGYSDIGNIKIAGYNYGSDTLAINPGASNDYSDFTTTLPPIVLQKNGLYPLVISHAKRVFNYNSAKASVFIDFNQNGKFENYERFNTGYFANTIPQKGEVNIIIPQSIPEGITRMRIVMSASTNYYPIEPACGNYASYGETEDYAVDIIAALPCLPLVHGSITTNKSSLCHYEVYTLNYAQNLPQTTLNYTYQQSVDSINWTTVSTAYTASLSASFYGKIYYRCIATCAGATDTSEVLTLNYKPVNQCYCASAPNFTDQFDIGNIKLAGLSYGVDTLLVPNPINHSYTDFTDSLPPFVLETGGYYPMEITRAPQVSLQNGYSLSVTIDYNINGIFEYNEVVALGVFYTNSSNLYSTTIAVPAAALSGLTRMRVIISSNSYSNPCSYYGYGETEDYAVQLMPQSSCSPLLKGFLYSAFDSICINQPLTLKYSGNLYKSKMRYSWQESLDSVNWNFLANSFIPQFSITGATQGKYFRCIAKCDAFADTSKNIFIARKLNAYCYCFSAAFDARFCDIGNIKIAGYSYGSDTLFTNPSAQQVYTNFTDSLPPIVLQKGGYYPIKITNSNTVDTVMRIGASVFCDFNQDASFENFNEKFNTGYFTDSVPAKGKGIIFVPIDAVSGITRMRIVMGVVAYSYVSCGIDATYGETEDYALEIIDPLPCDTLQSGFITADKSKYCYGKQFNLSYSGNSFQPFLRYMWQGSTDSITWTNLYTSPASTYSATMYVKKYVRCIATCGLFSDTSNAFLLDLETLFYKCNCSSYYFSSANQDIGNVSFLTLNNGNASPFLNNNTSVNNYSDFTNLPPVDIIRGFVYPLSVTQINRSNFHRSTVKAYIDFDHNGFGSFGDAGEGFFIGNTSDTVSTLGRVQGNIAVPYNAQLGITAMRVLLSEEDFTNAIPSCGNPSAWGETEDYLVNILPNSQCVQPSAGTAIAPINMFCPGDSAYIYLQGNSNLNGESYQWEKSSDSLQWSAIGAPKFVSELIYKVTAPIYIRCKVFCDTLQSVSNAVYLSSMNGQNVCNTCSYLGGSECSWNNRITNVSIIGTPLNNTDSSCYRINDSYYYLYPPTAQFTATLSRGGTYPLAVTTSKNCNLSVWLDYDGSGTFATNEWLRICDSSIAGMPNVVLLNVPLNAKIGPIVMRIRNRYSGNPNNSGDACTYFYSGETEDYILTIDLANAVNIRLKENDISVAPNPATSILELNYQNKDNEETELKLVNSKGQLVFYKKCRPQNGVLFETLDVTEYSRGVYILQIANQKSVFHKKIVLK